MACLGTVPKNDRFIIEKRLTEPNFGDSFPEFYMLDSYCTDVFLTKSSGQFWLSRNTLS